MTVPSVHCEARKLAYRQSKDGLVVSFTIHPDDMPATLAAAPLGQRYMLVLAAIGDDEEPVPQTGPVDSGSGRGTPSKQWKCTKGHDLCHTMLPGPSCQYCESPAQQRHIEKAEASRERYHNALPEDQAVMRAGRHCADIRFQNWIAAKAGWEGDAVDTEVAARWLRNVLGIPSRKVIATDRHVRDNFLKIETDYLVATGQTPEIR